MQPHQLLLQGPEDRKGLLRSLLEEVVIAVDRANYRADLTLRWRGGAITELEVGLPRSNPPTVRTDEDTIALVRRLAAHYPDAIIAGMLNRQGRRTARGHRFTAPLVGNLRRYRKIPRFVPAADPAGLGVGAFQVEAAKADLFDPNAFLPLWSGDWRKRF